MTERPHDLDRLSDLVAPVVLQIESLRQVATHGNVSVKVGGLGMRYAALGFSERPEPPSSEVVATLCRPYVETCIDAFGASRCMFESNFPVDKVSYSYQVFWNACKRLVSGASPNKKTALFGGTRQARLPARRGQPGLKRDQAKQIVEISARGNRASRCSVATGCAIRVSPHCRYAKAACSTAARGSASPARMRTRGQSAAARRRPARKT